MPDLLQRLLEKLQAEGWTVEIRGDRLTASRDTIHSKWLFGSRRMEQRVCVCIDARAHALRIQELAKETVIGIPPPGFTVTRSTQRGLSYAEERKDVALAGGGEAHYGAVRDWLADQCARSGWACETSIGAP